MTTVLFLVMDGHETTFDFYRLYRTFRLSVNELFIRCNTDYTSIKHSTEPRRTSNKYGHIYYKEQYFLNVNDYPTIRTGFLK